MPPILSEEPPKPNESDEEEEGMEDVEDNSAQDMDEDSIERDFEESNGKIENKSRDLKNCFCIIK